jgi:hypothetical protein
MYRYYLRYHWLCVGINSEPAENQDWFCTRCMAKKQVSTIQCLSRILALFIPDLGSGINFKKLKIISFF